ALHPFPTRRSADLRGVSNSGSWQSWSRPCAKRSVAARASVVTGGAARGYAAAAWATRLGRDSRGHEELGAAVVDGAPTRDRDDTWCDLVRGRGDGDDVGE